MYPIAHDVMSAPRPAGPQGGSGRLTPERVFDLAGSVIPWFAASSGIFAFTGLYLGFFAAPADAQQGQLYRIMYVHVPAAWSSLAISFAVMAFAIGGLARGAHLAFQFAEALVPTGALMSLIALWSGCLWGKQTLDAWWVWDPRLVLEFVLLLMYCTMMAVRAIVRDCVVADGVIAALALASGLAAVFNEVSMQWWPTLHQGASIILFATALSEEAMLRGVLATALGAGFYTLAVAAARLRCIILESEFDSPWVVLRGAMRR